MFNQRILSLFTIAALAASGATTVSLASPPPVSRAGRRPIVPGPTANFTGRVRVEILVQPDAPGRAALGLVTFSPGARTNWHSHPAGQSLYVTDGCGWTQREGGPVERICKGDVVYVPARVRHWHGATDTTEMTHLAISETLDGRNVDWAGPVSDAQFLGGSQER